MSNPIRKKPGGSLETPVDGDLVVMRMSDGDFFELRGTALAIWNLIDGQRGREEILAQLQGIFDNTPGMEADLDEFLAQLRAAKLVE